MDGITIADVSWRAKERYGSGTMPSSAVMGKWKHGALHSGSKKGPVVRSQAQAVAIMMSEKRKEAGQGGSYHKPKRVKARDVSARKRGRV